MKKTLFIAVSLVLLATSCEKLLDVRPDDKLYTEDALKTEDDFQLLLNSCYDVMANTYHGRSQHLSELLSDNLAQPVNNQDLTSIYNRDQSFFNGEVGGMFAQPYIATYRANTLMDELPKNSSLSDDFKKRVEAECRFIRAYGYFDLIRKFAQPYGYTPDNNHPGVVLRLSATSDPLPRATVGEVYDAIIEDLNFAADNLPDENSIYADTYAAHALLAKVYFSMNDFENAVTHSDAVINSGFYQLDPEDDRYSVAISSETVFGILSTDIDRRSGELKGKYNTNSNPTLGPSRELYEIVVSDSNDTRNRFFEVLNEGKENEFIGYNRFNGEYFSIPLLHMTELKLLRAEALLESGNTDAARNDLNDILSRAYGGNSDYLLGSGAAKATILESIQLQKRIELFAEGERIHDLKRRGVRGENITIRGAAWDCNGSVIQFPNGEGTSKVFEFNETGGC